MSNNGRFVIIEIYKDGNSYMALSTTTNCFVTECYGTTKTIGYKNGVKEISSNTKNRIKGRELEAFVAKDTLLRLKK